MFNEINWEQVGVLGGITVTLISLFSWMMKKTLNWVMSMVDSQISLMREDVHTMTQASMKTSGEFIEYLKEEARFRNKTWSEITEAVTNLTAEIRELRHQNNHDHRTGL